MLRAVWVLYLQKGLDMGYMPLSSAPFNSEVICMVLGGVEPVDCRSLSSIC